jgi:hypothetical protein
MATTERAADQDLLECGEHPVQRLKLPAQGACPDQQVTVTLALCVWRPWWPQWAALITFHLNPSDHAQVAWESEAPWDQEVFRELQVCMRVIISARLAFLRRNVDVQPGTPGRNGANGTPGERGRRGPVCVYTYCPSFISSISLTNRLAFAVHLVKVLRELQVCMRVCTSAQ